MALTTTVIEVEDQSQISAARRAAERLAGTLDFTQDRIGLLGLAATELATNVLKHAARGEILMSRCSSAARKGIELLAVDSGPGFAVERAIQDGHSTAGSLGHGLGALRRISDHFEVFSQPGKGSVVLSRFWSTAAPPEQLPYAVSGLSVPKPGEQVCGDGWAVRLEARRAGVLVVDGLGHGLPAADAAAVAVDVFERDPLLPPAELAERLHEALRPTRGAAVAIAALELERELTTFVGIGNIAGLIVADNARRNLVSHNGTAGHVLRRVQAFTYPMPPAATLVLHSDGLATSWNPSDYAGLWTADPAVIAGVLYRDYSRKRDDVTVVAARRQVA